MRTHAQRHDRPHSTKLDETTQRLIMIECAICNHLDFTAMGSPKGEALLCGGLLSRHCPTCSKRTLWNRVDVYTGGNRQATSKPTWTEH